MPFLGRLPLYEPIRVGSDRGIPLVIAEPDSAGAKAFMTLAEAVPPEIFAKRHAAVVALTGETDLVADGARIVRIGNGHPLMARVTAMGCAESAFVAAALAVEPDPLKAVACALLLFGIAGDMAGEAASGPGTFGVHILDALFNLDGAAIRARAKVST